MLTIGKSERFEIAAYLSDLVAVFEPIRLKMMVAESAVRRLLERSMESTGSVPLSFMISRGWPSRLQMRVKKSVSGC